MLDSQNNNSEEILSLAEASKLTGYHPDYLGQLCRSGKLAGKKIGRNWTTTAGALAEFARQQNGEAETASAIAVHVVNAETVEQSSELFVAEETTQPGITESEQQAAEAEVLTEDITDVAEEIEQAVEGLPIALQVVPRLSNNLDKVKAAAQQMRQEQERQLREAQLREQLLELDEKVERLEESLSTQRMPVVIPFSSSLQGNLIPTLGETEDFTAPLAPTVPATLSWRRLQDLYQTFINSKPWNSRAIVITAVLTVITTAGVMAYVQYGGAKKFVGKGPGSSGHASISYDKPQGAVAAENQDNNITVTADPSPQATIAPVTSGKVLASTVTVHTEGQAISPITEAYVDHLILFNLEQAIAQGWLKGERGPSGGSSGSSGGTSLPTLTAGSVIFSDGATLAEDNSNLFYDDANNALGLGTASPDASAILDLTSTTKGLLAPRMTTVQRNAVVAPATGLLVYNTTTNQFNVWTGASWSTISGGGGGSTVWSDLTDPSANLALTMQNFTTTFTYSNATGAANLFTLADTAANTGTGYLLNLNTGAGSTLRPLRVSVNNGTDALIISAAGLVTANNFASSSAAITGGSITATPINNSVIGGITPAAGSFTTLTGTTVNGLTITNNGTNTLNIATGKTVAINNSLTFGGTDGTSFTFPAANDTLVGRNSTDTLTNKTIAAGSNTITGLTNANLSGTAGITNANLANSSVTVNTTSPLGGGGALALGGSLTLTCATCVVDGDSLFTAAASAGGNSTIAEGGTLTLAQGTNITTTNNGTGTITIATIGNPTFGTSVTSPIVNATTEVQTGGTARIDVSGNLTNIGNLTGTGAITIASSGAGNDITINGADQFIVQDVAVFNGTVAFGSTTTFQANDIVDAEVSDTLTSSLFVGSGSTTTAIDLATAEVAGILPIANGGTNAATSQAAINNLSQLTTNGDLFYYNGTNSTRFARGADGECLKSNATTLVWGGCTGSADSIFVNASASDDANFVDTAASGTVAAVTWSLNTVPSPDAISIVIGTASATEAGIVTTGTQTFAGDKTFNGTVAFGSTTTFQANDIIDAEVSNTLTSSLFVGSGSTTNAIDLGTAEVAGILGAANGGTSNGFTAFTGPTTSTKTFTLPDASATILTDNATVTVGQGGTGAVSLTGVLLGNGTSPFTATTASAGISGALSDETGSGALVFATSPTLTTPRFADGGFLADSSGNELLVFDSNASAVNEITIANAATGNGVTIAATGGDTDVALSINSKGAGSLSLNGSATGDILFGGGVGSTGCTLTNSSGAFACTGAITGSNISGSSSGTNTGDVTLAGENYLSIAGQVITANAVNLSGTNATGTLAAARFPALTGDVTTTAGSLATTIAPNSVALGTDTTNDYVASFTAGTGLTGDASGEGSTPTLSVNTASGVTTSGDNIILDVNFNPTWTADHSWTLAGAEDIAISHDGTGGAVDLVNLTITPSATSGTLNGLVVSQGASGNTNPLDAAIRINNLDNDVVIPVAFQIANTGGGGYTTIIDNQGTLISSAEINLLDGHDAALVDTNDAVNTAITGTGALGSGSITSGFGSIDVGTDTITTTGTITGGTINATTALQTGSTTRVDSSGNLTNIGNLTATAGITIASTGVGDITLQARGAGTTGFINIGEVSASPDILVVGTKNTAGNPTGVDGGIYYNSNSGKFFIQEGGTWKEICNKADAACGAGSGSAWNALTVPTGNLTLAMDADTTTFNWTATSALDPFTMTFANNAGSATTQNGLSLVNALTTQTTDVNTESLLRLDNADTSGTGSTVVDDAILITNSGGISNGITDAIDASATEIVNAINVGANNILGTTAVIDFSNFDVSGAGAVTAVGVNSGSGLLQGTGGLTLTGTTNINTSGAANTNIGTGSNTGAVSIGNATSGALAVQGSTVAVTSTGAGNDITLTSADQIILNGGGTIELQDNTNITGTLGVSSNADIAGTLAVGTGDAFTIDASGNITKVGNITATGALTIASTGAGNDVIIDGADQFIVQDVAVFNGTVAFGSTTTFQADDIVDAEVSDTLTSSLFVGSGSTTTAIDLATAEVAGILPDANVIDALTISSSGSVDWLALTNYPTACAAGSAVSTLADVPTCTAFNTDASITLQDAYNAASGNSITTTDAKDIDIVLANTTTDSNLDIQIATDSTSTVSITRAAGGGTANPAQLLLLEDLDADLTVADGLAIRAAGILTDAIDVSDDQIVNALNVGANTILGTTAIINFDNFDVSSAGLITTASNLAVNGGTISSTGTLTLDATSTVIIPDADAFQTNDITPTSALTVGATGQTLALQGSTSTITSTGAGNDITLNSADTIELQDNTNVTGALGVSGNADVGGTLFAGTGDAFQVATNGNVTAGTINTNTFTSTALTFSGAAPAISASTTDTSISLNANGTGAINIGNTSTGDILFGGGVGSTGCTLTNSSGAFACTGAVTGSNLSGTNTGDQTITLTGDVTGSGTGSFATTIAPNSVALGTDTTNDYVASFTAGTGLTGDATGEGSTPTLSVNTASGITTSGDNIVLDINFNPTWTADHTWTLAGAEDLAISHDGTGGTVDAVNISVTPSSTAGTLNGLVITQGSSGNTNPLDAALRINNGDNDVVIPAAIQIANTGGGGYTSIIDNQGTLISGAELNLIDGHDVALVDTNDAVNTAITGTGALGSGSITSGFGSIDVGTDTITTTGTITGGTINATTALQTGSTTRIDSSGNLTNIGNLTATSAITIASTGAGNDITLNSVDQIILNGGGTIELQDNTNITGNLDVSGTIQAGSGNITLTDATGNIQAGAYAAGSIDGDDINSNIAGNGLVLTAGSPDTLDIDLLGVADGTGSTFSFSGLEFQGTSSDKLTLLQGCSDGQLLKYDDVTDNRWECANDSTGGAGSLQSSYDGGNSIETAGSPVIITETGAGAHTHDLLQLTVNPTSSTFAGDALQITLDGGAADAATGNGINIVIDQTQNTGNAILVQDDAAATLFQLNEDGAITLGTLGSSTAITVTDTDYTNALSIDDNDITGTNYDIIGTTATVDFTNFDVDASGNLDAGGTLAAGTGNAFQVNASGAVTAVGVNAGAGLLQGSLGLTVTGAAVSLNASSNFDVNIATGTSTGDITLGGGTAGQLISINSDDWDISTAGAITGVSFDANGSGNSISNIESADVLDGTLTGDDIASSIAGAGLVLTVGSPDVLDIGAGTGITVNPNDIAINQAFTPTWTGAHIFQSDVDLQFAAAENLTISNASATADQISQSLTIADTNSVDAYQITIIDNTATSGTGRGLVIETGDGTASLDAAIAINNTDTGQAITNGILITGAASTAVTTALNVSDDEIGTALAAGANDLSGTSWNITGSTGAASFVGVNAGAGLLQGSLGLTVTGAAVSLNASSNFDVNIATGTSTGDITLGGGTAGQLISINSDDWDISTAGAITGVSFDANGSGNSISNIESADVLDGTLTGDDINSNIGGNGLVLTAGSPDVLDVDLLGVADGTGSTFSFSGLEFQGTGSDKLTLLQGCADGQLLKYDDVTDNRWECAADVSGGAASLQSSYDGGNSIETSSNSVIITETGAGTTHDLLQLTANPASSTFSGDALQITMDGGAADAFTGNGLHIVIDQSQNSGNAILIEDDGATTLFQLNENGGLTLGAASAETTAITITDPSYTNALSIAAANIIGTTAAIDFSSFDVSSAGAVTSASTITGTVLNGTTGINTGATAGTQRIDSSGNLVNIGNLTATGAITIASAGATNDVIIDGADQLIVQDAAVLNSTLTVGGLATFNTDVDFTLAAAENLALTSTTGSNSVDLFAITLTNDDGGANTQRGIVLTNANSSGVTENLLLIDNADVTTASLTDGILITSSGANGGLVDAIDASAGNIDNAINIGANAIAGTNFSVTGAGAVTAVGVNSGTGQIQGSGGMALTGATNINLNTNSVTNINTGTSNTLVTIGGGSGTFALDTTNIDISSAGAITNATGVSLASGNITTPGNISTSSSGTIASASTVTVGSFAAATSVPVCSNSGTLSTCNSNPSSVTLQQAYTAGNSIETASNTPVVITETTATNTTGDLLQLTFNAATGGNNAGDALQITLDAADADGTDGNGIHIVIDQSQNTGNAILIEDDQGSPVTLFQLNENGGLTLGAATAETTAITITDTDYTNALSIAAADITGTNYDIIGTTASINFTNFDVSSAGQLLFTSVATDITTGTDEDLTLTANGTGDIVLALDSDTPLVFSQTTGTDITTAGSENLTIYPGGSGDTLIQVDAFTTLRVSATSAAAQDDMVSISNTSGSLGTITNGVDALFIDFNQADDSDATDVNAALHIALVGDSVDADTLQGINIADLTGASAGATSVALNIGSGWDTNLQFADTSAVIKVANTGSITFEDDSAVNGTDILVLQDISTANNHVLTGDSDTGLQFSGATVDLLSASGEVLTLSGTNANLVLQTTTSGNIVLNSVGTIELQDNTNITGNLDVSGTIQAGSGNITLTDATGNIQAGAYAAASIDGDDINSNLAGNGLVLTAGSPDTLDIDLLGVADGTGSTSSFSGMEFQGSGSDKLTLLQGCNDGQILEYTDAGGWACGDDTTGGAGSSALNDITAATANNGAGINNANFAQIWNWNTLTTQTGMNFTGGTAMTTGSVFNIGTATYVHAAAETGELMNLSFTDASTNASGASNTYGLNIAATINTTGAGTKTIQGINIEAPTVTTCTSGACTYYGAKITGGTGSSANITSTALYVDAGTGSGTEYAAVFTNGNVGIGVTAPASLLHIQQAADSANVSTPVAFDINSVGAAGELTATSGTQIFSRIAPTINQVASTAGYTALQVNVTETSVGTGTKNLLDLQAGSNSKFAVANTGDTTLVDGADILQNAGWFIGPYGGFGKFENLLKRSEEFDDDTDWIKTNVTDPTLNTQTAPDGSTTAESLVTTSSGGNACNFSGTAAGSDTFTFSVWARSSSGTQSFGLRVDAGATSCATANNVDGTESTFTATTSWKRFTVTQTFSSATGNVKARIFPGTVGGSGTVYAWGAQLEKASVPSVYAKTTSGALTNDSSRGLIVNSNLNNTAASGFVSAERHVNVINSTTAGTHVGQFVRMVDNTSLSGATHIARAIWAQGFSGTNVNGVNSGIFAQGYTFGIEAETTSQGNGTIQPAAVFADLNNGAAPTSGNAIRAFTDNATSANLVSFYQEASTFTGTGLLMNFGNTGGSFSGNFLSLQVAAAEKMHVDSAGVVYASFTSTGTRALCHASANGATNEAITDCSGTPVSDFAEMYPVDSEVEVGDVVISGTEMVNTYDTDNDGNVDWNNVKGKITRLEKSQTAYQNIIGVVSDNYSDFVSTGYNIKSEDNPKSIALAGRVIVKVTNENGDIEPGDFLTSSATFPGYAMKATRSGQVIGQALSEFDSSTPNDSSTVMVFVKVGYQYIGNTFVLDAPVSGELQGSGNGSMSASNTSSTFVIKQETENAQGETQTVADILQLQSGDANRFMVANTGAVTLNSVAAQDEDLVLTVKRADADVFTINARGDAHLYGVLVVRDDNIAGSLVTTPDGTAEITFTYHLGTGKPSVQLTPEADYPVFAQVLEWKKDSEDNYTGFVMKTFGFDGQPTQSIVNYLVVGKPQGYETFGLDTLEVIDQPDSSPITVEDPDPEPDSGEVAGDTTPEIITVPNDPEQSTEPEPTTTDNIDPAAEITPPAAEAPDTSPTSDAGSDTVIN